MVLGVVCYDSKTTDKKGVLKGTSGRSQYRNEKKVKKSRKREEKNGQIKKPS